MAIRVIDNKLSVRETERLVRDILNPKVKEPIVEEENIGSARFQQSLACPVCFPETAFQQVPLHRMLEEALGNGYKDSVGNFDTFP